MPMGALVQWLNFFTCQRNQASSPYVKAILLHSSGWYKSLSVKACKGGGDNPKWTSSEGNVLKFLIPKEDGNNWEAGNFRLRVEVYLDVIGRDTLIGYCSQTLDVMLVEDQTVQVWKLVDISGNACGELLLTQALVEDTSVVVQRDSDCDDPEPDTPESSKAAAAKATGSMKPDKGSPFQVALSKLPWAGGKSGDDSPGTVLQLTMREAKGLRHLADQRVDTKMVRYALLIIVAYFVLGCVFYSLKEGWTVINSVYFAVVTLTTTGYGDLTPTDNLSKLFTCLFAFLGIGIITSSLGIIGGYLLDEQHRLMLEAVALRRLHLGDMNSVLKYNKKTTETDERRDRLANAIFGDDNRKGIWYTFGGYMSAITIILFVGAIFFHYEEDLEVVDAVYLSCISLATVGYGDIYPTSQKGRLFTSIWLLYGTVIMAKAIGGALGYVLERRRRQVTWKNFSTSLAQQSLGGFDEDGNGIISRHEFLSKTLIKLKKVSAEDIRKIDELFKKLDKDNSGTLTEADLQITQEESLAVVEGVQEEGT